MKAVLNNCSKALIISVKVLALSVFLMPFGKNPEKSGHCSTKDIN
ncbi:hypothetical protein [Flammeovirga kamogawensis]|nr:hypothetical protein [Flammeovirga kamogawensis]MBB6462529.1 hypothetical protein [Flammeovirga kamogawensis]